MSIYTKTGDDGTTSLLSGERVPKNDIRIEVLGKIDELTSVLGIAKTVIEEEKIREEIGYVQKLFIYFMADISEGKSNKERVSSDEVTRLERLINEYQKMFPEITAFIVPGSSKASAHLDHARTLARSAERNLINLEKSQKIGTVLKKFFNRLSDYLYTIARYIDFKEEITKKVTEMVKMQYQKAENIKPGETKVLNLDIAKRIMELVEKRARFMNLNVVIAVADASGNPIAVHFMDGALPVSFDVAVKKAYTAAAVKMSTEELSKIAQPGQPFYGVAAANDKMMIIGGGVPLKIGDKIVGAIAVSGGTAEQDIELSNYGSKIFEEWR
ncbi:cob(I)yrinic acid a,c-diamide adenosyltransferase [Clostridium sp. SYSU_GA19001]|uniref:cob(I)yrinic acid a,c-diamide adenosyltransferase n=1 Tax=Clostridium caldaquaticum TaxID=2940653 RepID=UPI00207742B7|nr:cob(I)yrinic acid a,c-diamide adenosyltransferase [Clostridium caldaquaticum]MCM8710028.1 cob(I)yrinic acid a,c-diamide adenosyltransferase [Clostridium caldaquaticum]